MKKLLAALALATLAGCAAPAPNPAAETGSEPALAPADFLAKYPRPDGIRGIPDPAVRPDQRDFRTFPGGLAMINGRADGYEKTFFVWDGPAGTGKKFTFWTIGVAPNPGRDGEMMVLLNRCAEVPGCKKVYKIFVQTLDDAVVFSADFDGPEMWPDEKMIEFFKNTREIPGAAQDFVEKFGKENVPRGFQFAKNFRVFPGEIALFETSSAWANREIVAWHGPSGETLRFGFRFGGTVATAEDGGGEVPVAECAATPTCRSFAKLFVQNSAGEKIDEIDLPGPEVWSDEKILEYFRAVRGE